MTKERKAQMARLSAMTDAQWKDFNAVTEALLAYVAEQEVEDFEDNCAECGQTSTEDGEEYAELCTQLRVANDAYWKIGDAREQCDFWSKHVRPVRDDAAVLSAHVYGRLVEVRRVLFGN